MNRALIADPAARLPVDKAEQPLYALGLLQTAVSGSQALRHAGDIRRHAARLGYVLVYIVRPPETRGDPVGYTLDHARRFGVSAIVVPELSHVCDQPARICDAGFDLETIYPQQTWARSRRPGHFTEISASDHCDIGDPDHLGYQTDFADADHQSFGPQGRAVLALLDRLRAGFPRQ